MSDLYPFCVKQLLVIAPKKKLHAILPMYYGDHVHVKVFAAKIKFKTADKQP